ncbi:hypothetical protein E0H73_39540 [Kribbella pittospori]|uniref:Uncharacterized protein n=1 Tax=Kribbella pittospori TaxID=722689 RepID=A0A4R0K825_9ACTN|nr:hypothetical protein [Kribbella pittospori]TCC54246.1 hypothetical protein E0H73_39540 [Kribbella pittospori]
MNWLENRAAAKTGRAVQIPLRDTPWIPAVLENVAPDLVSALTYVVIDERDAPAGELLFVLSEWPRTDDLGRVRHRLGRVVEVSVSTNAWQTLARERRVPAELRERPPQIGDAFAMMLASRAQRQLLKPIGPIVDITAAARNAARASFYGAVAAPLDGSVAETASHDQGRLPAVTEPAEWRAHLGEAR